MAVRKKCKEIVTDKRAERRRARAEEQAKKAGTFAAAAVDYVEHIRRERVLDDGSREPRLRGWRGAARVLGIDVADGRVIRIAGGLADRWSDKTIGEINEDDVFILIRDVEHRGVPGLGRREDRATPAMARVALATLSSMFAWLKRQRRVAANPCHGVDRPDEEPRKGRALTNDEIAKLWRATESEQVEFQAAIRLLILTGQRRGEVCGMRWSEIGDFHIVKDTKVVGVIQNGLWSIPATRSKNKLPHKVPLTAAAVEIMSSFERGDGLVLTRGTEELSLKRCKKRLEKRSGIEGRWTIHDIRHTVSTGIGIPDELIDLITNHRSGTRGGITGRYNKSERIEERKAALERWCQHVLGLVAGKPDNVVPLRSAT
jgi:integrase